MPLSLSVDRVSKRYGSVTAVDNISFQAHEGRILGLLVGVATLLATVPLMRTLNNRWVESQRCEVEELADSIADQAVPTQAVPTVDDDASVSTASGTSHQAPEVSLPGDHSEPSGPESNRRNRNR